MKVPHQQTFSFIVPAVCLLLFLSACAPADVIVEPTVAFTGVNVIPGDTERILEDHTVLVRGDRILEVGPSADVQVPDGARSIDGTGKYLIPGFAEMHGHIPPPTDPAEYVESVLFLFVANGVTTVRGMLGHENQLELRDQVLRGEILGPTLYLAGPSFSGRTVESAEQAEQRVRQQKEEGWDLLKVHPGLQREHYDAMARTAAELDIPFAGHVPAEVGILHALEMDQQTIDHLDGYIEYLEGDRGPLDETQLQEVVTKTREAGAWVIPTMILWETILGSNDLETLKSYQGLEYVPPQNIQNWIEAHERRVSADGFDLERARRIAENRKVLLQALHQGGVKILFGTDAPQQFSVPGFSIHREMQVMSETGMTPFEIIQTASRNVGEYFEDKDSFGTVEADQRADLILLDANPLDDVSNIARRSGVMVRGRWLPEEEIQQRLEDLAAGYRQTPE